MRKLGVWFALWSLLGSLSATADCGPCDETLTDIRSALLRVQRQLNAAERGRAETPVGGYWDAPAPAPDPGQSPFFQRLEAEDNWKASQTRLEAIERELQKLEAEIAAEKTAGRATAELIRLERLAHAQRLIVEELRFQLTRIRKRFEELDRRIDAHEQRIAAIAGDLEKATAEVKAIAANAKAHLVASGSSSYESVLEAKKLFTRDLDLAQIWVFPRTELRYEDTKNLTTQTTVAVEGSLFGLVKGEAKGGLVFDTRYSTEAYVLTPGTQPFLSTSGAAMRDAAVYCAISKTFTFRGFGSASASVGLDVKVVKLSTGVTIEAGETISVNSKRYGDLLQFRQGETFQSKIAECHKFARQVRDTDLLSAEVSSMLKVTQVPESPCYKDFDCRKDVKLGMLLGSVVSNCIAAPNRERAICQHRYVDSPGATCSLPNERTRNFRYACARGFRCDGKTRKCLAEKTGVAWLNEAGLAEAKAVSLSTHFAQVFPTNPPGAPSPSVCARAGGLSEGWRLPTQEELHPVAEWYRQWVRAELRARNPRAPAQAWFYPAQAYTGLIWSAGPWVYLLNNDSGSRYNPADPQTAVLFRDPKTGNTVDEGIVLCVRSR